MATKASPAASAAAAAPPASGAAGAFVWPLRRYPSASGVSDPNSCPVSPKDFCITMLKLASNLTIQMLPTVSPGWTHEMVVPDAMNPPPLAGMTEYRLSASGPPMYLSNTTAPAEVSLRNQASVLVKIGLTYFTPSWSKEPSASCCTLPERLSVDGRVYCFCQVTAPAELMRIRMSTMAGGFEVNENSEPDSRNPPSLSGIAKSGTSVVALSLRSFFCHVMLPLASSFASVNATTLNWSSYDSA